VAHIGAFHGGTFQVLSGEHAGKSFPYNSIDTEGDQILGTDLGPDPRGTRMLRLTPDVPVFTDHTRIQTEDGKQWTLTRADYSAYLTHDYRLVEVTAHDA